MQNRRISAMLDKIYLPIPEGEDANGDDDLIPKE